MVMWSQFRRTINIEVEQLISIKEKEKKEKRKKRKLTMGGKRTCEVQPWLVGKCFKFVSA
jgi:hypothetical protein